MNLNIQSAEHFICVASDEELSEVFAVLRDEMQARERAREEAERMRGLWANIWFLKYLAHPNATAKTIGDTTVVALYSRTSGVQIATARCMPGDTYDNTIGIAVAYAKLCQEPIPDYI
jgi:hypothetical protein